MEDEICSPEKYSVKNSYFNWMKKIYMIKIFLTEYKFIFTEWKYIFWYHEKKGDIMRIYFIEYKFVLIEWKYFDIMKKGDIMEICFIKYKIILIEWKYIFISYELLFLQHFSNHARFAFQEDIIDISFFLQIFFLFAFVITNTLTWKKIRTFSLKKNVNHKTNTIGHL